MLIWSAMSIPVLTAIILWYWYRHKTLVWEFLIPFVCSAVLILICKLCTELSQTSDTEYWGGWVTHAEHYEDWNERVPCSHPKYETRYRTVTRTVNGVTTTSQQSYQVQVGWLHPYDVSYHPEYWEVNDSNEISKRVNKSKFESLVRHFNNRKKVDLHRNYHTNDGDKFVTKWLGEDESLIPFTSKHRYENRVQATNTIIDFKEVDPEQHQLFEYPDLENYYECSAILGNGGPSMASANKHLNHTNAILGRRKQIRIWILIFEDQPLEAGFEQRDYWKGGNKNEFILTIGVNKSHEVQWCYPISWSEVESLKVDARNFVINQKGEPLDLMRISEWLRSECQSRFVRKEFADFDYLTVDPPTWAYVLTFVLTIMLNAGLSWFIIVNEYEEDGRKQFKFPKMYFGRQRR